MLPSLRRFFALPPPQLLFFAALAWHVAWAGTVAAPSDWDPAYALAVARHLVHGDGAVTGAVWNLGWLPPALVHPADLHWMPLPSRILVPFLAVAPAAMAWPAAQLCSVLVAATWAPLAWVWARRLGASPVAAWCAGFVAATGGGYVRIVTTPDSIGLYGALGAAALLAASERLAITSGLVALAALTRGDGFLLGLACALAWPDRGGLRVALAGVGATAAWSLRSWLLAGQGFLAMRARVFESMKLADLLTVTAPTPPTWLDRGAFTLAQAPTILAVALVVSGGLLVWPALLALWRRRSDRGLWPIPAYALGFPPVIHLLAPAIAAEGSVFRSGAAVFVPLAALAVVGAESLTRRYHPAFLPILLVVSTVASAGLSGRAYTHVLTQLGADCEALAAVPSDIPVLSYDPIGVEARCGHPGVIMGRGAPLEPLVEAYGLEWALVAPPDYDNGTVRAVDWTLPGWEQLGPRLWHKRP